MHFKILSAAVFASLMVAGSAAAQTTTLRIGNWLPGHHLIPRGIIEPWARAIERESNGTPAHRQCRPRGLQ
jgi:hypothetical protein